MLARLSLAFRVLRGLDILPASRPPVPRDIHDLAVAQLRQQVMDQQRVIDTLMEAWAPGVTLRREVKPKPVVVPRPAEPDEPEMPFV